MSDYAKIKGELGALTEIVNRANVELGYPKVGKQANGARNVGNGPHVRDDQVISSSAATIVDDGSGLHIVVTDDVEQTLKSIRSAAATRVSDGKSQPGDALIAQTVEEAKALRADQEKVVKP